jgi:hypothetical protein
MLKLFKRQTQISSQIKSNHVYSFLLHKGRPYAAALWRLEKGTSNSYNERIVFNWFKSKYDQDSAEILFNDLMQLLPNK